jgi:hypothetical protein
VEDPRDDAPGRLVGELKSARGVPYIVPIPRSEFDRGKAPASWEQSVLGFLNSHPSEAFGIEELAKAIQYPISPLTGVHSLHALLHRLAAQGKVDERIVRSGSRAEVFYATMG